MHESHRRLCMENVWPDGYIFTIHGIWMAILLLGIAKSKQIDKWLKADTSAIEALKDKVSEYINYNKSHSSNISVGNLTLFISSP